MFQRHFFFCLFLFFANASLSQNIISGSYDSGLALAYDSSLNFLSGYFESYSGEDGNGSSKFSCIFYLEGKISGTQFSVMTYYPSDKAEDLIEGKMEILNDSNISLSLPKEHGGCWNVQHFADDPETFKLKKQSDFTQIRYVVTDKTFFYREKSEGTRMKAFVVKDNFLFIDKINGEWVHCIFEGKTRTVGWIKVSDLNKF